uniref:Uncharacterized protein n=1 Tax=viral metagenome TaxID=1070528 RepID=A0A6M3IM06_9ZZZZ
MARIYNPLIDGEVFDEIDLGDNGSLMESDRIIDRVTIDELEYSELFGSVGSNDVLVYR